MSILGELALIFGVCLAGEGIAAILPGERITEAAIEALLAAEAAGATLFGAQEGRICVVKHG